MSRAGDGRQEHKKKPRKKRQRVRAHWKPSLGIFVETYRRRGDAAKRRRRRAGAGGAAEPQDHSPAPVPPKRRRLWWVVAAVAVLLTAGAVAVAIALLADDGLPDYELRAARKPLLLAVDAGTPGQMATATAPLRRELAEKAAGRVLEALRAHPQRVVVIDLPNLPPSFRTLPPPEQGALRTEFGAKAETAYEWAVAAFLHGLLDAVGDQRVSVLGLPIEPEEVGPGAARETNARYRGVVDKLGLLVSGHAFLRNDTSLTEHLLVQKALPEALRWRDDRPVLFRSNAGWRVLVQRDVRDAEAPRGLVLRQMLLADDPGAAPGP